MAWLSSWLEEEPHGYSMSSQDLAARTISENDGDRENLPHRDVTYIPGGEVFDSFKSAREKLVSASGHGVTSKGSYVAKDGVRYHKFVCTYHRRRGWQPCGYRAQIVESNSTFQVRFAQSPYKTHQHERLPDYVFQQEPTLSNAAMNLVERHTKEGLDASQSFRSLRELGQLPPNQEGSKIMKAIYNKRSRTEKREDERIGNTKAEIRAWCESKLATPSEPDEAYCLDYMMGPNTYFIFSTTGLLSNNASIPNITVDFTNGLSWLGFKTLVCGSINASGQFRLLAFALTCKETATEVTALFAALRRHCEELGINHRPDTLIGDSAESTVH
ncbi:hypothetical protein Pmar_PMAR028641 [Perkinsus marinus ATCC 50983]|uniref:MULE transposase domain-containing protein n=1 Tax=Perkinsus marinus (strain ATCC 50983 / TXsc) TaxID=423536 RepID=C5K8G9_PERM5|nr:hypothetical protein Pmar_PMAR028641 [Perkinsus marinus ATCC 50983]EER19176.1 hypothetical protein Pmar_PMAR028641 [Perkinsus marinus ATCC 50983]|eukprot:XP_002787380.1 hypothetical protein Pmar_PMAR028641 [Perkinsus marinus ATCC 50983]